MTSKNLIAWRKKNGFKQNELARILGVTPQTVYRWENGKREIPSFLALTLECLEKRGGEGKERKGKGKKEKGGEKVNGNDL